MNQRFLLLGTAFWGAAVGLIVAKYLFGATNTDDAEMIAVLGFLISFGVHLFLRRNAAAEKPQ